MYNHIYIYIYRYAHLYKIIINIINDGRKPSLVLNKLIVNIFNKHRIPGEYLFMKKIHRVNSNTYNSIIIIIIRYSPTSFRGFCFSRIATFFVYINPNVHSQPEFTFV